MKRKNLTPNIFYIPVVKYDFVLFSSCTQPKYFTEFKQLLSGSQNACLKNAVVTENFFNNMYYYEE